MILSGGLGGALGGVIGASYSHAQTNAESLEILLTFAAALILLFLILCFLSPLFTRFHEVSDDT